LEGVEALGEILRRYRRHPGLEIHLIENRKRLLANRPKALDRNIRKICKPYKVRFHTDTRVTKMARNKVQATMAKFDPPSGLTSAINFCSRTSESIFNLAIPTLTSFSSLRRLAHVQFLS
jgi:NADH dehydrogenase FAD-containing subunit